MIIYLGLLVLLILCVWGTWCAIAYLDEHITTFIVIADFILAISVFVSSMIVFNNVLTFREELEAKYSISLDYLESVKQLGSGVDKEEREKLIDLVKEWNLSVKKANALSDNIFIGWYIPFNYKGMPLLDFNDIPKANLRLNIEGEL